MTSVDRTPWVITADRSPALKIVLSRQTVVLSWSQFVYAEGSEEEVRIAFASHDLVVKGAGLSPLLHAIAAHQVTSIFEPGRFERFSPQPGRFIREIEVRRVDAD